LVHGSTSNHLLLLSGDKKLASFMGFSCEISSVRQKSGEVDNILVNQHASDATSKVLTEGLLNN
jgi:hypothetical protein